MAISVARTWRWIDISESAIVLLDSGRQLAIEPYLLERIDDHERENGFIDVVSGTLRPGHIPESWCPGSKPVDVIGRFSGLPLFLEVIEESMNQPNYFLKFFFEDETYFEILEIATEAARKYSKPTAEQIHIAVTETLLLLDKPEKPDLVEPDGFLVPDGERESQTIALESQNHLNIRGGRPRLTKDAATQYRETYPTGHHPKTWAEVAKKLGYSVKTIKRGLQEPESDAEEKQ